MDHHVTTDLSGVEAIVPDFQQTHRLVGDDMEDEDIQGMITGIDQELLDSPRMFVDPLADVIGHQKAKDGWYGERQELLEGRTPVHVGREILGE